MASAPAGVTEVAVAAMRQADRILPDMIAAYGDRIPEYSELLTRRGDDVTAESRLALLAFLRLLSERRDLSPEERELLRQAGRKRAAEGLPLRSLLLAYAIGREVALDHLLRFCGELGAGDEVVAEITLRLTRFVEVTNLLMTQEYLAYAEQAYELERKRLHTLVELSKALNRSFDLAEVVEVGLSVTREALGFQWAGFWLVDHDRQVVRMFREERDPAWEEAMGATPDQQVYPLESRPGQAAVSGEGYSVSGDQLPPRARAVGCKLFVARPVRHHGHALGLLGIASNQVEALKEGEIEFLDAIAEQLSIAVNSAQEHRREARTDFLTKLANRIEFDHFLRHEVGRAERQAGRLSLALVDLDGLKAINDGHGHAAGDAALVLVANVLRGASRAIDLAARIGGDEFALVMPDADLAGAEDVIERVRARLAAASNDHGLPLSISAGVVDWQSGTSVLDLVADADARLYAAKRARAAGSN